MQTAPPNKLAGLQIVRAVAANLVVISHLLVVQSKYLAVHLLPSVATCGIAGVDLFFVLSGFIMASVAGRGVGPLEFLWRRAGRIYPTYWLVSAVVLVAWVIEPQMVNSSFSQAPSLWRSFLLIPDSTLPLLAVGWTLIHEMYFYLIFALIIMLGIGLLRGIAFWAFIIVVLRSVLPAETLAGPTLHVITHPLTAEFMMGAILGALWRQAPSSKWAQASLLGGPALMIVGAWIAVQISMVTRPDLDLLRVVLFGLPAAVIVHGASFLYLKPAATGSRLLVTLGDCSYSTYLVHVLVISALGRALGWTAPNSAAADITLMVGGVAAANIAGLAIYRLFERPSLDALRRVRRSHATTVSSPLN